MLLLLLLLLLLLILMLLFRYAMFGAYTRRRLLVDLVVSHINLKEEKKPPLSNLKGKIPLKRSSSDCVIHTTFRPGPFLLSRPLLCRSLLPIPPPALPPALLPHPQWVPLSVWARPCGVPCALRRHMRMLMIDLAGSGEHAESLRLRHADRRRRTARGDGVDVVPT